MSSRQNDINQPTNRLKIPSPGNPTGSGVHRAEEGGKPSSAKPAAVGAVKQVPVEQSDKPRVRERSVPCPVCKQRALVGYWADLPAGGSDYNNLFLPVLAPSVHVEGFKQAGSLALLDNYFCRNDLFTYTGHIKIEEKEKGPNFILENNVFHRMSRYYGAHPEEMEGHRVAFFLTALKNCRFNLQKVAPPDNGQYDVPAIAKAWDELLNLCAESPLSLPAVYKCHHKLVDRLKWNPLTAIMQNFYQSASINAAFFEMQLADLLYVFRREKTKQTALVTYDELYRLLDGFRKLFLADTPLDDEMTGNVLFHCLKMADLFTGERRQRLLETAYAASKYLVRIKSRLGTDLNQKLDVLAGNADVTFYLFLRLCRELKQEDGLQGPVLRLLRRRLEIIADYSSSQETEESIRVARIGKYLKKFTAELAGENS